MRISWLAALIAASLSGCGAYAPSLDPLVITTASLADAAVARPYDAVVRSAGGRAAVSWAVVEGAVPPGLVLQPDGRLFGIPVLDGRYRFAVQATSGAETASRPLELTVAGQAVDTAAFGGRFVLIPPGTMVMGSDDRPADERPAHLVALDLPFMLGTTEVTQSEWLAVMGTRPSYFTGCGPTCPAEQVSWDDAQAFLDRLNVTDPGKGYRLPTEAEWEYAARAGTTGNYAGTGVAAEMGWYYQNSGQTTHPVGGKAPNAWGLYDMHGNVAEWVQDYYSSGYYRTSPRTDPRGPVTGEFRVVRGGSWLANTVDARSAARSQGLPGDRFDSVGFRVARSP